MEQDHGEPQKTIFLETSINTGLNNWNLFIMNGMDFIGLVDCLFLCVKQGFNGRLSKLVQRDLHFYKLLFLHIERVCNHDIRPINGRRY